MSDVEIPAADILAAAECSPMCLLARCPEPCGCRCEGVFHGLLVSVPVPCDDGRAQRIVAATGRDEGALDALNDPEAAERLFRVVHYIFADPKLTAADIRIMLAVAIGRELPDTYGEFARFAKHAGIDRSYAYRIAKRWLDPDARGSTASRLPS